MGRTPLSGWRLIRHLRRAGIATQSFAYWAACESFARIRQRLLSRLVLLAERGDDYIVIGHSLGGVLLRASIADLPTHVAPPRQLFLLGSPLHASRLARRCAGNPLYRALTADCGQLLASDSRMAEIGASAVPATAIIGRRGLPLGIDFFPGEASDGIVTLAEVSADWLSRQITVQEFHSLLPSNRTVGEAIVRRTAELAGR